MKAKPYNLSEADIKWGGEWYATYGYVYKELIDAGLDAIMAGLKAMKGKEPNDSFCGLFDARL